MLKRFLRSLRQAFAKEMQVCEVTLKTAIADIKLKPEETTKLIQIATTGEIERFDHRRAQFKEQIEDAAARNRAAMTSEYQISLRNLINLSPEEIDSVTPDSSDDFAIVYNLLVIVADASKRNLPKSELAARIKEFGIVTVEIAKKDPILASLL